MGGCLAGLPCMPARLQSAPVLLVTALARPPSHHAAAAGEKVLGESAYNALDINSLDLSGTGLGVG